MNPIPAGALFTVTCGEYSDYYVRGVFRALKEIDVGQLRDEWLDAHPEQRKGAYRFKEDKFFASVCLAGFAEPVECWEWHLTDYSNASEMTVDKMPGGL